MAIPPIVKENPIKAVSSLVAFVVTVIGTFLTVDDRYAHAVDVQEYKAATSQEIQQQTTALQQQLIILRQQAVEDKVWELDVKRGQQSLSPVEEAQYKRYIRQLDELRQSPNQLKASPVP